MSPHFVRGGLIRAGIPSIGRVQAAAPLRLTLQNETGDEVASATTPPGEAAVKSAILLLARSEAPRPGNRLTVSIEGGAQP